MKIKSLPPGQYMLKRHTMSFSAGKAVPGTRIDGPVRVMASAEGYSMVRFPGAMPFAVSNEDLAAVAAPTSSNTNI